MRRAAVVKLWVGGACAAALVAYLAWFIPMAVAVERGAARAAAAVHLDCPIDRLELGPSRQEGDGPSQYDVRGCGKTAHVECEDTVHGFPDEYLRADARCWVSEGK